MKRTIRQNICAAYSLHDMNVDAFDVQGDTITMRTQTGIVQTTPPYSQVDGYVRFEGVRWDFSYAYMMTPIGNTGEFSGKKVFLRDFLAGLNTFGFCIMDETYGYNMTKLSGFLTHRRTFHECIIEIYHEGDMIFVAEE